MIDHGFATRGFQTLKYPFQISKTSLSAVSTMSCLALKARVIVAKGGVDGQ